jgi:hypothetical protein
MIPGGSHSNRRFKLGIDDRKVSRNARIGGRGIAIAVSDVHRQNPSRDNSIRDV